MKHRRASAAAVILSFLALLGCESRDFKAERSMWRAHKMSQQIYKNPKGSPPSQLTGVQNAYRTIIKEHPDSLFAIQAQFSIGHLYLVKGEFQKARDAYEKLTLRCDERGNACAEALFAIGNTYELEGKWDDALEKYRKIMEAYPFSTKSLDLPVYIIRHYRKAADEKKRYSSVDQAAAYYEGLKAKNRTEKGDYILDTFIARSYAEGMRWQEALDAFEKIAKGYPKNRPEEALLMKALIYNNHLRDKAKAKEELLRIAKEYPASKLAKNLEAYLKKLGP